MLKFCVCAMPGELFVAFDCLAFDYWPSFLHESKTISIELCRWYVHVYLVFSLVDCCLLLTQHDTAHVVSVTACRATSTIMTAPMTVVMVVSHSLMSILSVVAKRVVESWAAVDDWVVVIGIPHWRDTNCITFIG